MNLKDRMAGIDANLDDLQSGVEACSRAADALRATATASDVALKQVKDAPGLESLSRRVADLQACTRDQRGALRELREAITRLHEHLERSSEVVRPPPLQAEGRAQR